VVYVADTYNDRIRRIATNGDVTTIAGGKRAGLADGAAAQALFDTPTGLAISAAGDLYIADTGNNAVRKLDKNGNVSTVAVAKEDDRNSLLRLPIGLALTPDGFLYLSSNSHGRLAQITPAGEVVAVPTSTVRPSPATAPTAACACTRRAPSRCRRMARCS
jgi:DNA-binding beta-propeller fold protein YncE